MWEIKACEKLHDWNSPKPTELDCLTAAGPALPVCPINWSNNWVNTGHEYSSVSLLGKDLKRIASPWQWCWLLCKAFSWEGTASVLSKKEPDAISIQLFLGLDVVCCTCPACAHFRTEGMVLPFIYPKHQHPCQLSPPPLPKTSNGSNIRNSSLIKCHRSMRMHIFNTSKSQDLNTTKGCCSRWGVSW